MSNIGLSIDHDKEYEYIKQVNEKMHKNILSGLYAEYEENHLKIVNYIYKVLLHKNHRIPSISEISSAFSDFLLNVVTDEMIQYVTTFLGDDQKTISDNVDIMYGDYIDELDEEYILYLLSILGNSCRITSDFFEMPDLTGDIMYFGDAQGILIQSMFFEMNSKITGQSASMELVNNIHLIRGGKNGTGNGGAGSP